MSSKTYKDISTQVLLQSLKKTTNSIKTILNKQLNNTFTNLSPLNYQDFFNLSKAHKSLLNSTSRKTQLQKLKVIWKSKLKYLINPQLTFYPPNSFMNTNLLGKSNFSLSNKRKIKTKKLNKKCFRTMWRIWWTKSQARKSWSNFLSKFKRVKSAIHKELLISSCLSWKTSPIRSLKRRENRKRMQHHSWLKGKFTSKFITRIVWYVMSRLTSIPNGCMWWRKMSLNL